MQSVVPSSGEVTPEDDNQTFKSETDLDSEKTTLFTDQEVY